VRRLAALLAVGLLALVPLAAAAPAGAATPAPPTAVSGGVKDGTLTARLGGFRSSRGFGTSSRRSYGARRGYGRRRGSGFLRGLFHGLFWGWLLSHVFGGGFPLVLPLLLLLAFVAFRRRRPPAPYRW
jgi:hypothetical protein